MRRTMLAVAIAAAIVLSACPAPAATVSLTGNIQELTGVAPTTSTFARFTLQNCGTNIPRVDGVAVLGAKQKDVRPNAAGAISDQIYGNSDIECGGTTGTTYYTMSVYSGTILQFSADFQICRTSTANCTQNVGATFDITTAAPLSPTPPTNLYDWAARNATNTYTSTTTQDLSGAAVTRPFRKLTLAQIAAISSCTAGVDYYTAPDAPNGQNIYVCNSTGTAAVLASGGGIWGSITGTLSSQSDLQTALNGKQASLPLTTMGDLLYMDSGPVLARLAGNTASNRKLLCQTGNGLGVSAAPSWCALALTDIPTLDDAHIPSSMANKTFTGALGISAYVNFYGTITPAQITADQNDYSPSGLSGASILRLSSDATRTITGVAGGTDGRFLILRNVGTQNLVLASENAGSAAANRFTFVGSLTLAPNQSISLTYDVTTLRWRPWQDVATTALTAAALAANGTNCPANQYSQGVDAAGNAEGCAQPSSATLSDGGSLATKVGVQQQSYEAAADTGAANAYAVCPSPAPTVTTYSVVVFKASAANTGASTLAVCGGTANPIVKRGGSIALVANDILAGAIVRAVWDGAQWQMTSQLGNANKIETAADYAGSSETVGDGVCIKSLGPTQFANCSASLPVNLQTGTTYTIATSDLASNVRQSNAGAITDTVPDATGATGGFADKFYFWISNDGATNITVNRTAASTFTGATFGSGATSGTIIPGESCRFESKSSNWYVSCGFGQHNHSDAAHGGAIAAAAIPSTAVTPGSYTNTNLTVGADGRITAAANGSAGTGSHVVFASCGGVVGNGNGTWYVIGPAGNTAGTTSCGAATNSVAFPTFPVSGTASHLCATVQTACTTGLDVTLWNGSTSGTMAASALTVNMTTTAANTKVCDTLGSATINLDDYWAIEIRPKQATETCKAVSVSFKVQ